MKWFKKEKEKEKENIVQEDTIETRRLRLEIRNKFLSFLYDNKIKHQYEEKRDSCMSNYFELNIECNEKNYNLINEYIKVNNINYSIGSNRKQSYEWRNLLFEGTDTFNKYFFYIFDYL